MKLLWSHLMDLHDLEPNLWSLKHVSCTANKIDKSRVLKTRDFLNLFIIFSSITKLQHIPIKHIIISKPLSMEKVSKYLTKVRVVRFVIETQRTTIIKKSCKLSRMSFT